MALKTHNEVTPFYRHFKPSETFGTVFQCQLKAGLTHAQAFFRGVHGRWTFNGHSCHAHARDLNE